MPEGDGQAYQSLLGRLFAARRFGMRLELERMERCLARLGRPQERARVVVQVAGTNGKGSTAAFVDAVLRAGGVSTGLYASPHLLRLTERFRVGGQELAPSEVVDADRAVAIAAAEAGVELTFFEQVTAIGVVAFAARGVEVMVLEVGMGGRHDATTAVGAGVAVVTGVALDHQEHLGDTVEAIALEKAGIFRAGQHAVVGAAGEPEAVPILCAEARARGVAALTVIDAAAADASDGPLGLAGRHQRRNAAAALAAVDCVEAALGRRLDPGARARGLAACRLPGRLERVAVAPAVIVDGAHNPQAARVVARSLDDAAPGAARWVVVLGVSSDKDAAGIAAPLVARASHVIVTRAAHERALDTVALDRAVRAAGRAPGLSIEVIDDVAAAIDRARALAGPDGAVLVAGSLFLVGEARAHLLGDPRDGQSVSDPVLPPR